MFRPVVELRVLSRTNLSYPSRHSSSNPRPVNLLQPLCSLFTAPALSFQQLAASFCKTPGVGVPLRGGCRTEAQKCPSVSPLPATLTHSVSRKSFPCHSYANTRDRGVTPPPKSFSPLATRHSPLDLTPFRINTCKSVSKQRTLTTFRMNTYQKQGEGGNHGGTDRAHPLHNRPGASLTPFLATHPKNWGRGPIIPNSSSLCALDDESHAEDDMRPKELAPSTNTR